MKRGLYILKPPEVPKKIGELLVEAGLISEARLKHALEQQEQKGGKIVDILISQGDIDAATFVNFLSKCPGIPSIDLSNYEVPQELIALVPRELAAKHEVFPIEKMSRILTVGMVCPLDRQTIEHLQEVTGHKIRPILCSGDAIRSAIRRYYGRAGRASVHTPPTAEFSLGRAESAMHISNISHLVKEIHTLPPLPRTVEQLRTIIDNPKSSISDVAKLLSTDPTASAKLLSLTNSAAFSFSRTIRNIQEAVSLLGLRHTYEVVLAAAAMDLFSRAPYFDQNLFWQDAVHCANCAVLTAEAAYVKSMDGIFASAIIHDIGRVVLAWIAPERFSKVDQTGTEENMIDSEREIFMVDHAEVGYMLACNWGLPEQICQAIRFHHNFQLTNEPLEGAAAVALACGMLDLARSGRDIDDAFMQRHEQAMLSLKLPQATLVDLVKVTKAFAQ